MKMTERPEIAQDYIQHLRDIVEGRKSIPSVQYDQNHRKEHTHGGQLYKHLCPLPPFYKRAGYDILPSSDDTIMKFGRGRGIERLIATEQESVCKDGIWITPDDKHPKWGWGEIKSTAQSSYQFNPEKECPYWISQIEGAAYAVDTLEYNLIVWFLVGNMPSYTTWAIKDYGYPKGKYKGTDMKAWTLEFTEEELHLAWGEKIGRKHALEKAIETNNVDLLHPYVEPNLPFRIRERKSGQIKDYWQCKNCECTLQCYYYEEVVLNESS